MRALDPNLPTAVTVAPAHHSDSASKRSRDSRGDDSDFRDVYSKTAAARQAHREDQEKRSESRAAANKDAANDSAEKAAAQKDAANDAAAKSADRDDGRSDAAQASEGRAAAGDENEDAKTLQKLVENAGNLDEDDVQEIAADLDMSAAELDAVLQELAEAGNAAEAKAALAAAAGDDAGQEEDNIAALFKLLLGQKKAADGKDTEDTRQTDSADSDAASDPDAEISADDIASLLAALKGNTPARGDDGKSGGAQDASAMTFRFERADGKGTPVELQIGGAKDGLTLEAGKKGADVETVTVLDSRRFLAPAEGNTTNVISALTGDKGWAETMKAASGGQVSAAHVPQVLTEKTVSEVNTLKIQMHPVDLGTVTATLRLKGDDLIVNMNVHTAEAYHQLNADKEKLIQSLKSQGFSVDQVNITLTATPDRGVQQSASSQQHQSGQQMQGGNEGDLARQQQQESNRRQQTNDTGNAFLADEVAVSNSAGDNAGRGAGQLYI